MENAFDELTRALAAARDLDRAVERQSNSMAALLKGHLRSVHPMHLESMKRELAKFNLHTQKWMN